MLRVCLIDDDAFARQLLRQLLEKFPEIDIVGEFGDALQARDFLEKNTLDVLFLDVNMPDLDGFGLLKLLRNPPQVVLVSGEREHALKAFNYNVTDYLLKPVVLGRLAQAIDRLQQTGDTRDDGHLFVRVEGKYVKVVLDDIHYLEAQGDYVKLRTADSTMVVHTTLRAVLEKLPGDTFLKVHRSYVVNLKHVADFDESTLVAGKKTIPVSRTMRGELIQRLNLL